MKIQGNTSPAPVQISAYSPKEGMVRLWLRENIVPLSEGLYEYDEYTTILPNRPGLEAEVTANLPSWLETLRSLEVDARASVVVDMKAGLAEAREENAALVANLSELDESYRKGVNSL